jgi:hypothetical protein
VQHGLNSAGTANEITHGFGLMDVQHNRWFAPVLEGRVPFVVDVSASPDAAALAHDPAGASSETQLDLLLMDRTT